MKVWVMQGSYEGELFSSVHLTEKGCALACISDIVEFLGVEDEETALSVMNNTYHGDPEETTEPIEWDQMKLKHMTRKELWKIFADWSELSWDRMADRSFYLDANAMEIQT
jgi:hypothetical protein|tara:strand:+ start:302 stop:634 length:333 start_codon:yes stop_codon:yes gene_type:complete